MYNNDTIAAIATPAGTSGIGIIRISGNDAIAIADRIIKKSDGTGTDILKADTHTIYYGYVFDGKECIDEVLIMIMKAPRSYTTEDTVEINCHGGIFIMQRVLEIVIKAGARTAEPGEFTKRAYLNGRIDLSEAESVMDIISSENEFARKNAIDQLKGTVKQKVDFLRDKIMHETAFIEAALDDPEHYDLNDYPEQLGRIIEDLLMEINHIISDSNDGRILKDGINTVIVGKPNVGKSSVLNLLSGYEKAIVTDIAGTTRDAIEETISIEGIKLNIIDTAGIHDTKDTVEAIGIERAVKFADTADLILFVIDSSKDFDDNDRKILSLINKQKNRNIIILYNKCDIIGNDKKIPEELSGYRLISFSAMDRTGYIELKNTIKNLFINGKIRNDDQIYITNMRQLECFRNAKRSLELVRQSIDDEMSEDVFSVDLLDAYNELGKVIGENTDDDLADRIFSEFCMGK